MRPSSILAITTLFFAGFSAAMSIGAGDPPASLIAREEASSLLVRSTPVVHSYALHIGLHVILC